MVYVRAVTGVVRRFFDEGHGVVACQRALGFSHLAWIRAIRRGILRNLVSGRRGTRHPGTRRLDTRRPCTRRPDTQRPCTGVPACRHAASRQSASRHPASAVVTGIGRLCSAPTMPGNRKCRKRFGFCSRLSTKAVRRGELTHGLAGSRWLSCFPLAELLLKPSTRQMVKKYLLEAGILVNVCEERGRSGGGNPSPSKSTIATAFETTTALKTLEFLCPNCHSQTDTFGARNLKRSRERVSS